MGILFCNNCGEVVLAGSKFCPSCGVAHLNGLTPTSDLQVSSGTGGSKLKSIPLAIAFGVPSGLLIIAILMGLLGYSNFSRADSYNNKAIDLTNKIFYIPN